MVRIWILLSVLLVASGWILSAIHALNRPGYGVVFVLAGAVFIFWQRKRGGLFSRSPAQLAHKFRRRFTRWAPRLFLAIAFFSLLAGSLYAASNGDSNAYRTPRILHWLAAGHWHWIHTFDQRMNIAGCGFEWLSAPIILFTRTDQWIFLINVVSYLMLPGLIFSVFIRVGVRRRVAWWWMWILSSGWCFALQAGSVVNDSFAAVYALAAVDLALRAKERGSISDLWLSLLAAALLTGAKQTNIPLALLWFIAAWPAFRLSWRRPAAGFVVAVAGLLVSIVPITIFNLQHTGNWIGYESTSASSPKLDSPFWGIAGNAFCIPVQNLMPPFFPWVEKWDAMMDRFVATPFGHHFISFEHFGRLSFGAHGVNEGNAGIGLGICVFFLISVLAALRFSRKSGPAKNAAAGRQSWLLRVTPWALLLVFMAKNGSYENARQLSPYYAFLFPAFLTARGHAVLVRRRWWQLLGLLVMLFTVGLLVIARNRPMFPAQTILHWLHAKYPNSHLITRGMFSYDVRSAVVQRQRDWIAGTPARNEKVIGYATTIGAAEPGLWFPLGQRQVIRVTPEDTAETLRSEGIHYVVVDSLALDPSKETIEQWMEKYHGELVDKMDFRTQPTLPPSYLYLVRLRP